MNIGIRAACVEDAQILAHIGAATFALACPRNTPQADLERYIQSELTPPRFLQHLACSTASLFVAEVNGSVVGYLMLGREEHPSVITALNPLELRRIYVLADFHGSHVATMLMTMALQQAAAGKHDVVWLGVSKHNDRAIAFYRKHGFSVVGEQGFMVGSAMHQDLIMTHALAVGPA